MASVDQLTLELPKVDLGAMSIAFAFWRSAAPGCLSRRRAGRPGTVIAGARGNAHDFR